MYETRSESIKTFITDGNVKLPGFRRRQTWDEKIPLTMMYDDPENIRNCLPLRVYG